MLNVFPIVEGAFELVSGKETDGEAKKSAWYEKPRRKNLRRVCSGVALSSGPLGPPGGDSQVRAMGSIRWSPKFGVNTLESILIGPVMRHCCHVSRRMC